MDKPPSRPLLADQDVLEGWQAIAGHLGVTPKTAQRWERDQGAPVRRERSTGGGARVSALRADLDAWRHTRIHGPDAPEPTFTPQIEQSSAYLQRTAISALETSAPAANIRLPNRFPSAALVALLSFHSAVSPKDGWIGIDSDARSGRLLWQIDSEDSSVPVAELPQEFGEAVATFDGAYLLLTALSHKLLFILNANTLAIRTLNLPEIAGSIAVSRAGDLAYLGSQSGALTVIALPSGRLREIIQAPGPISDIALSPNGRTIFIAMREKGVSRLDTTSHKWSVVTPYPCPWYNRLDRQGKRLAVSFQCGGPGGREGHDAVEIYDVDTGRRLDSLVGPPMVGGAHEFSPDGSTLWLDGGDACSSSRYDHEGCPSSPAWVGYAYRVANRQMIRSFALPLDGGTRASFLGNGSRVLFAGKSLYVMDAATFAPLEARPASAFRRDGTARVSGDGSRVFLIADSKKVSVLNVEDRACADVGKGAVSSLAFDGSPGDAIGNGILSPPLTARYEPGFVGRALMLDPVGPQMTVSGSGPYRFGFADSTMAFYLKAPGLRASVVAEYEQPKLGNVWRLSTNDRGILGFDFHGIDNVTLSLSGSHTIADGRWHHLAVVKNATSLSMYMDGRLEAHATTKNREMLVGADGDQPLKLGWSSTPNRRFRGLVDELTMWARSLGPDEVRSLYERRLRKPCKP